MLPGTVPLVNVAKNNEGGNTQFGFSRMTLDSVTKYSCISEGGEGEQEWGGSVGASVT